MISALRYRYFNILIFSALFLCTLFIWVALGAQPAFANENEATIKRIGKNGQIILTDDRRILLAGIIILPSGRAQMRAFLKENQKVRVIVADTNADINTPIQADIEILPNFFMRDELLKSGHALMLPHYLTLQQAQDLRALEQIAKARHTGIWRKTKHPAIITPEKAVDYIGQYKIVRGNIVKHDVYKGNVYLNFGHEWDKDFTIRASEEVFATISQQLNWGDDLTNSTIQCRGVLHQFYGPAIDLNHAGQCVVE